MPAHYEGTIIRSQGTPILDLARPEGMTEAAQRRLIDTLSTPRRVQQWLNEMRYNAETNGETLRSFRGVVRTGTAHCLEAALAAAVILEQHGYPPIVMSIESQDWLDHVVLLYREASGWGAVARSRDPGLNGRKPLFRSPRGVARMGSRKKAATHNVKPSSTTVRNSQPSRNAIRSSRFNLCLGFATTANLALKRPKHSPSSAKKSLLLGQLLLAQNGELLPW